MHETLITFFDIHLSPWECIGILGSILFSGRWIVQVITSRDAGTPVVTRLFWYMGIAGNLLILSYFIFGKNDTVGIISNLFPTVIGLYNLWLFRQKKAI